MLFPASKTAPHFKFLVRSNYRLTTQVRSSYSFADYLSQPVLINVYIAIFHFYLIYSISTWGSTYEIYIANLQTLQNKAMRIIEGLNWNARLEDMYNKRQIFTVSKMYKYEVGKMMLFLVFTNWLPELFLGYFSYISFSSTHNARGASASAIHLPQFSFNRLQHSFKFQGAKIWNAILNQTNKWPFKNISLN